MSDKLASVYERNGSYFLLADHQTKAGFWICDGAVIVLKEPDAQAIASAVTQCLDRSRSGLPTPLPGESVDAGLLKAAKVRSRKAFHNGARLVTVALSDDTLVIEPSRNLGSSEGFEPMVHETIRLAYQSEGLGLAVLEALEKSIPSSTPPA